MHQGPVISIVDDDPSVRSATTKFLRVHGYTTHAFASAEEFLQSAHVDDTECLVADIGMRGMSGFDLQEQLLTRGHRISTIFVTAFPEERCQARASACRAAFLLSKPFDGQRLIDCIDAALRERCGRISCDG